MNGQTTNLVFKLILWLVVEVILNLVGLDDLANYSEFLFEHPVVVQLCTTNEVAG